MLYWMRRWLLHDWFFARVLLIKKCFRNISNWNVYFWNRFLSMKKKIFNKICVLFSRKMIKLLSFRWNREIDDAKKICRFFVHLISFQIFWTFFVVFSIAFRWLKRNVFLIKHFFCFRIWRNFVCFFWTLLFKITAFWKIRRIWLILFLTVSHASLKSEIARTDAEILKILSTITVVIA